MQMVDGVFTVTVSPEIFSNAGVMEAVGIVPVRSQENPPTVTPEQRNAAIDHVRNKLLSVYTGSQYFSSAD